MGTRFLAMVGLLTGLLSGTPEAQAQAQARAAAAAPAARATAEELQLGVEYQGPKLLSSGVFGVTFALPSGWAGGVPQDADYFLMAPPSQNGRIILRGAQVTLAQAQAEMAQSTPIGEGATLEPAGPLKVTGNVVTADYSVEGADQRMAARIVFTVGKFGMGASIMVMGDPTEMQALLMGAAEVHRSLRFAKPKPQPVAPQVAAAPPVGAPARALDPSLPNLTGVQLRTSISGSSKYMSLCSNGRFYWNSGYVNVSQNGTVVADNNMTGRWQQQGSVLTLHWDDGDVSSYDLRLQGVDLYLNDRLWLRKQTDCQ